MDISSSIAAASVYMHQGRIRQSVDIAVTKKAMDTQEAAALKLLESFAEMVPPSDGHVLDIKV